ncbi:hypothetical protein [Allokutzneria oryzae]|uniref:DUF732 domain-containing protein n=1 Tax=Allokutzneria oryzae TaxID=1378989 RepID=A0ABV5ZVF4_9PSEU
MDKPSRAPKSRAVAVLTGLVTAAAASVLAIPAHASAVFPYYYGGQGYSADYSAAFNYAAADAARKLAHHEYAELVNCVNPSLLSATPINQSGIWKFDLRHRATCTPH